MKLGQKVKIVGRFDKSQKPNAISMDGEVFKITNKRIYVVEQCLAIFVFNKETKKEIGGHWRLTRSRTKDARKKDKGE